MNRGDGCMMGAFHIMFLSQVEKSAVYILEGGRIGLHVEDRTDLEIFRFLVL
jgi:hypothetical protein